MDHREGRRAADIEKARWSVCAMTTSIVTVLTYAGDVPGNSRGNCEGRMAVVAQDWEFACMPAVVACVSWVGAVSQEY